MKEGKNIYCQNVATCLATFAVTNFTGHTGGEVLRVARSGQAEGESDGAEVYELEQVVRRARAPSTPARRAIAPRHPRQQTPHGARSLKQRQREQHLLHLSCSPPLPSGRSSLKSRVARGVRTSRPLLPPACHTRASSSTSSKTAFARSISTTTAPPPS